MKKLFLIFLVPGIAFCDIVFNSCTGRFDCYGPGCVQNGATINLANQYSMPYYSAPGSSNAISGVSPGTIGQVYTSSGTSGAPFWSNVSSGGGSFINNTSTLQSGATFYVSSGTVASKFTVGSEVINGNASIPLTITTFQSGGSSSYGVKSSCTKGGTSPFPCYGVYGISVSSAAGLSEGDGLVGSCSGDGSCMGIQGVSGGTGNNRGGYFDAVSGTTNDAIYINRGDISLAGDQGSSGKVLTSAGPGNIPTWSTASGSVVLPSSGIAFGSPTNTVKSDTTTLNYDSTYGGVIIGTDVAHMRSIDAFGYLYRGFRVIQDQSVAGLDVPFYTWAPAGSSSLNILVADIGGNPLGGGTEFSLSFQNSNGGLASFSTSGGYFFQSGSNGATQIDGNGVEGIDNGSITQGINFSSYTYRNGTANQFWRTSASGNNLTNYDLLNATQTWTGTNTVSTMTYTAHTFATLGNAAPNGTYFYCSDCTVTTAATCTANLLTSCVCAGSGTGAFAKRLNGSWYCQ